LPVFAAGLCDVCILHALGPFREDRDTVAKLGGAAPGGIHNLGRCPADERFVREASVGSGEERPGLGQFLLQAGALAGQVGAGAPEAYLQVATDHHERALSRGEGEVDGPVRHVVDMQPRKPPERRRQVLVRGARRRRGDRKLCVEPGRRFDPGVGAGVADPPDRLDQDLDRRLGR
jgi:hypothetical protein